MFLSFTILLMFNWKLCFSTFILFIAFVELFQIWALTKIPLFCFNLFEGEFKNFVYP